MELEDLEVYQEANIIADEIWNIVLTWDYFQKPACRQGRDTIGKQIVKSSDSIGANISEGYGRYFHKENLQFCYYARGSLFETKTWLLKSFNRDLISDEKYSELKDKIYSLQKKLNGYIKFLRNNKQTSKQVN